MTELLQPVEQAPVDLGTPQPNPLGWDEASWLQLPQEKRWAVLCSVFQATELREADSPDLPAQRFIRDPDTDMLVPLGDERFGLVVRGIATSCLDSLT